MSGGDLAVGLSSLRQSQVAREGDDATQLWIEALEAIQIQSREAFGGELARFYPSNETITRGAYRLSGPRLLSPLKPGPIVKQAPRTAVGRTC